jgi:hypothetical protein
MDLRVGWMPRDGVHFRFPPDTTQGIVLAVRKPSGENVFADEDGHEFLWLADIKTKGVQRNASELAKHMHTPGTNDFEWLREAGRGNKNIDFGGKADNVRLAGDTTAKPGSE